MPVKMQHLLFVLVGVLLLFGGLLSATHPLFLMAQPAQTETLLANQQIITNTNLIRPQLPPAADSREPVTVVMSENFEGVWPPNGWVLDDLSSNDGGEFLWGKRNCHPRTGSFAGWSVGGGAQGGVLPCSGNYPDNAYTWAVYGPFNLSGATAATLTYYYWGSTEFEPNCNYDVFFVGSSVDNSNFSGSIYCGSWINGSAGNGYYQGSLNLNTLLGQPQVWVAFVLSADSSVPDIGITIDDVVLDVTTATTPTSTPAETAVHGLYLPYVEKPALPTATATATATVTPTPTTAPPGTPQPGSWSGLTSLSHPMSFQVSANSSQWSNFSLTTEVVIGACSVTTTITIPGPGNITNNQISYTGSTFSFTGTFTSSTQANGTFNFINYPITGCGTFSQSGTWAATH